jgi:hypothetical protein
MESKIWNQRKINVLVHDDVHVIHAVIDVNCAILIIITYSDDEYY